MLATPSFSRAAQVAAANVAGADPDDFFVQIDNASGEKIVWVNWQDSQKVSSATRKEIEAAVLLVLPAAYRDWKVSLT